EKLFISYAAWIAFCGRRKTGFAEFVGPSEHICDVRTVEQLIRRLILAAFAEAQFVSILPDEERAIERREMIGIGAEERLRFLFESLRCGGCHEREIETQ